ncbi:binding-protein-dependent transporters inner membrane component [Paenibacillus terrae HPL-003]|uniref:Binding-protein-dependent transporters inner membrane component n=1 Tax=Paenibacillus terrae (strain HPL-003) TaxID=985665 RepID=G7VPS1_PAETH|nr:carbohydrate ABC transporter permease [Paenibacillus terrae]AET61069.1 binding-protein-dependent transporters inner membrane component [Paenibacillus terrae HPL-003]
MTWQRRYLEEIVKHGILLALAVLTLLPLIWMIMTSFKTEGEVFSGPLMWPDTFRLDGYVRVFRDMPFFQWLYNSVVLSSLQVAGQLVISILAAYAFAHFRFRGREVLFFFVLLTMMMPNQVTMVPTYIIVNELNWLNTFAGVIVPHMASGYAIFLLRQAFLTVPRELGEASIIDGCSAAGTLWHVYLRLIGPVLGALTIILFIGTWNDFQWPLLILTEKSLQPLPLALVQFRQESSLEYVPTMAAATLSMLPVLVLFMLAQKSFVEGFANSGLKG